jgi:hypothetical protein
MVQKKHINLKLPAQGMKETRILNHLSKEIEGIMILGDTYIVENIGVHEIERGILSALLNFGRSILSSIISQKVEVVRHAKLVSPGGDAFERKGDCVRQYVSVFGAIDIQRPSYWHESTGKVYYADEVLQLPVDSKLSYFLQELMADSGSEEDYRQSVCLLNKLLGLGLSGKCAQRNMAHLGCFVEDYYEGREAHVVRQSSPVDCYAVSFDGKGVPKIKAGEKEDGERAEKAEEKNKGGEWECVEKQGWDRKKQKEGMPCGKGGGEGAPKREQRQTKRLGKGEKPNVMQMATVSVSSCFTPKERGARSILNGLMYKPLKKSGAAVRPPEKVAENDNRWHRDVHRRAFLGDQQKAVDYGIRKVAAAIKKSGGRLVVPIDAGIGLEEKVLAAIEKYGLKEHFDGILLDIVHVSEYVWDTATAIFGEKSALRHAWVEDVMLDLLDNKVAKVIEDLELVVQKTQISQNQLQQLNKTIKYFSNHKHKMMYQDFLKKGYPVSSALVEAACGHLVKDRMEQSGMRWSSNGAQFVLDVRAVKQNDDMEDFFKYVIAKQRLNIFSIAA